jgi:hypothetical protein
MDRIRIALWLLPSSFALAAPAEVNVIVQGQVAPGVYGRVEIGNAPPPLLVYEQPVTIVRPATPVAPIYMHVPPGHARNWKKHCKKYEACGRPVYFVKSAEYEPKKKKKKKED